MASARLNGGRGSEEVLPVRWSPGQYGANGETDLLFKPVFVFAMNQK